MNKENVYKTYGWNPGDGDYSVKKELKRKDNPKKDNKNIVVKINVFIKGLAHKIFIK
ncbi:MAG: hypothetical protein NTY74_02160 [Ignavibacteriae bacterium]|nr:hypothetical protein [Ignavibacteriota bacterium]